MKKILGWFLFFVFLFTVGIFRVNLSTGTEGVNWFIVAVWAVVGILSLLGWLKLSILNKRKEVK